MSFFYQIVVEFDRIAPVYGIIVRDDDFCLFFFCLFLLSLRLNCKFYLPRDGTDFTAVMLRERDLAGVFSHEHIV